MPENRRTTAAWRIALWTTLAFSVGTFVAFFIVYLVMAKEIWARSDAWLTGEAQVLAEVAEGTPRDRLYNKIVKEVAELAMHEVPDERSPQGERLNNVFFLKVNPAPSGDILFVGPGSKDTRVAHTLTSMYATQPVALRPLPPRCRGNQIRRRMDTVYLTRRGVAYMKNYVCDPTGCLATSRAPCSRQPIHRQIGAMSVTW